MAEKPPHVATDLRLVPGRVRDREPVAADDVTRLRILYKRDGALPLWIRSGLASVAMRGCALRARRAWYDRCLWDDRVRAFARPGWWT